MIKHIANIRMASVKLNFLISILLISIFLSGCAANRAAFKPDYKMSNIKNVALGEFSGFGAFGNAGAAVRDEFVRQLMLEGYNVKTSTENINVILSATVTQYSPERKFLFYAPPVTEGQQQVNVVSPIEIGGTNAYSLGSALGAEGSRILVSNASIGISAKLVDPYTNDIIWTNSYTYEGFDINSAVESVVGYFVKSIKRGR